MAFYSMGTLIRDTKIPNATFVGIELIHMIYCKCWTFPVAEYGRGRQRPRRLYLPLQILQINPHELEFYVST